jgi:hypothetical protein
MNVNLPPLRVVTQLAGEWPDRIGPPSPSIPRFDLIRIRPGAAPPPVYAGEAPQMPVAKIPGIDLAVDAPDASPAMNKTFVPGVEGVDAMVAVGHQYVVMTQDHWIAFFDRAGSLLPSKAGEKTKVSSTEFFGYFLKPFNADGSVNKNCINRHLQFPADAVATCDLTKPPALPCVDEFYDTRCTYDPKSRRFFICCAGRNQIWPGKPGGAYDVLGRRYFAYAVSKTEDPRDGFRIWFWNDNKKVADWPRIAVNGDNFVVAHQFEEEGKPLAYVFSVPAMLQAQSNPPHWTYGLADVGGGDPKRTLVPVTHHGDTGGLTYIVRPGATFEIYAFAGSPAGGAGRPALMATSVSLGLAPSMLRGGAVYRDGKIYFACMRKVTDRVTDQGGPRMSVRLVRIPVKKTSASSIQASTDPAAGFLDHTFGRNAPEDDPDDLVSYEMPALAVGKNGVMVVAYGRVGVTTKVPLFPEARYSVYYPNEKAQRRSRVLKAGNFVPTFVHPDESKPTDTHYFDAPGIDYGTSVVDPVDDSSAWMAHEFANKARGGFKTVVGVVKP